MSRPIWQFFLVVLALAFAVRCGAVAFVAFAGGTVAPALLAAYVFQTVAALATALGIWRGALWALGALVALAIGLVATAFLESLVLGVRPLAAAVGQAFVVSLAAGALCYVLRREFGGNGPAKVSPDQRSSTQ